MPGRIKKVKPGRLSHRLITTNTIKGELRKLGVYPAGLVGEVNLFTESEHDARAKFEHIEGNGRYNASMSTARLVPFVANNPHRLMRLCEQWVEEDEMRYKAWQKRYRLHLSREIRADRQRIRTALNLTVEQLPSDPDEPVSSASEGEDESEDEDDHEAARTAADIADMVHALTDGDGPPAQALAPAPAPAPEPVEDEGDTDHNLYEEKAAANDPYVEGTVLGRRRAKQNPRWWMYKVKFDDDTEDWYSTKEVKHFITHYKTVNK